MTLACISGLTSLSLLCFDYTLLPSISSIYWTQSLHTNIFFVLKIIFPGFFNLWLSPHLIWLNRISLESFPDHVYETASRLCSGFSTAWFSSEPLLPVHTCCFCIWASPVGEAMSSTSADISVHSLLLPSHRRVLEISQELSVYLWHECFNPYISFSVTSKFEVQLWVCSYMAVLEHVDGILTFSTFRMNICMFIIWNSDLTGCFVFYHTTFPRGY